MRKSRERIPNKVLKEIFPKKLSMHRAQDRVYSELKQMILSNKLKKGKRLLREEIAQDFDVSETIVSLAFSKLKKEGLVIIKWGKGSFVAQRLKKTR
ncbi:MAG: GntR family transcriptional regulator [Thermodesulfobacteriota bacterium]|jgi:DNA-binding GntR family transcriptional regulator